MRKPSGSALVALSLAGFLAGCASEGTVTQIGGNAAPLPPASSWALSVTGCPKLTQCEELHGVLAEQLVGSGLARSVVRPGQGEAERSLELNVSNLRAVPTAVRIVFGVMAGRNEVSSTATVRGAGGTVLRTYEIKSSSTSHPFSGESMEVDAYKKLAAQAVQALRS